MVEGSKEMEDDPELWLQQQYTAGLVMEQSRTEAAQEDGEPVPPVRDHVMTAEERSDLARVGCLTEKERTDREGKRDTAALRVSILRKSAGMLYAVTNCGMVVGACEIYGSESKTQVYIFLCDLLLWCKEHGVPFPSTNLYDDACHLLCYVMHKMKKSGTAVALASMDWCVDKMHWPGHT